MDNSKDAGISDDIVWELIWLCSEVGERLSLPGGFFPSSMLALSDYAQSQKQWRARLKT